MKLSQKQKAQLRIDFIKILIPTPERRDPKSFPMIEARRTIDELVKVVKTVIEDK